MARLTYKKVKNFIEIESNSDCKLSSKAYIDAKTKMVFLCKCGNTFETTYNSFKSKNKRQCDKCGVQKRANIRKLDYNDVKRYIEDESNSGCKLLSEKYVNNTTKILLMCKCGNEFYTTFANFRAGTKVRCDECGIESFSKKRRKTNSMFKQEVSDLVGEEYIFLEEYITSQIKIKCKHNKCNHIWETTPSNFLKGRRCPNCNTPNRNRDTNQFKMEVRDMTNGEYILMSEYIDNNTHVKIRHIECGNVYNVKPSNFLTGHRCPTCSIEVTRVKLTKTNTKFESEVFDLVGYEFSFLEPYVDAKTKILCRHNECGHEWSTEPNAFLRGSRCPICSMKEMGERQAKTNEEFVKEVYDLVGSEYTVLDRYIRSNIKIRVRHNRCGNIYKVTPNKFSQGRRCPRCNESKGEQQIRFHFENINIKFKQEYTFNGLIGTGGNLLKFDFAIFDSDGNLKSLIEYDGEFHYNNVYEDGSFETLQIHDKRKNQYCKDNDIPLLRIPYWDFDNIEKILDEWLDH